MKHIFMVLSSILVLKASSQTQAAAPITDLTTPSAPGFVLADKAPSSVEKPTTPRAFGISLLNLWQGGAVEVTPYWLTAKPKLTFDKFINNPVPFLQTLNFSVASFKDENTSSLSGGAKAHLLRVYAQKSKNKIQALKDTLLLALTVEDPDNLDVALIEAKNKELKELTNAQAKGLFILEVAGALLGSSSTNSYKNLASTKSGVWANLRWSPYNENKYSLNILGVSRYSWANNATAKTGSDSAFLDYGLALNFQKGKFDLAAEYVNRRDISIKKNVDRFAFVGNYMITENIIIVVSLGKNFDKVQDILTVFGVKFALSKERLKLN